MRARWGRIVFVSSVVGLLGAAGQANYAASKAGLVGLARSLARELGSRGITANVVAPGPIATDMIAAARRQAPAELTAAVPLGRIGSAEEVAAAVAFLASDDAGLHHRRRPPRRRWPRHGPLITPMCNTLTCSPEHSPVPFDFHTA